MKKYVYFECDFIQGVNELDDEEKEGALACAAIDGYPADENASGTVICNIWLTAGRQFIIDWHHNDYRMNQDVLDLIELTKKDLMAFHGDHEEHCSVMVFPKVEFDDGTACICKYHSQNDKGFRPGTVQAVCDIVRKHYEEAGKVVTSVTAVSEAAYDLFNARSNGKTRILTWDENTTRIIDMESKERPGRLNSIINAVYDRQEAGLPVSDKELAAADLYRLSENQALFARLFETVTGTSLETFLEANASGQEDTSDITAK